MSILLCDVFCPFVKKIIYCFAPLPRAGKECMFPVMPGHNGRKGPCWIVCHVRLEAWIPVVRCLFCRNGGTFLWEKHSSHSSSFQLLDALEPTSPQSGAKALYLGLGGSQRAVNQKRVIWIWPNVYDQGVESGSCLYYMFTFSKLMDKAVRSIIGNSNSALYRVFLFNYWI